MKFLQGAIFALATVASIGSIADSSDIVVSSSANAQYFYNGRPSDLTDTNVKRVDNIILFQDSIVRQVEWAGTEIPIEYSHVNPLFEISFHHNVDDDTIPFFGKIPSVEPFASYVVEGDAFFNPRAGTGQSGYIAHLPEELSLPQGDYWMSIALAAPNIGEDQYTWGWSRANGLGFAANLNTLTGEIILGSMDHVFTLWGQHSEPQNADEDGDGVPYASDLCLETNPGEVVDALGCADYEKDSDNDGVMDDIDECPNTPEGTPVDGAGCAGNNPSGLGVVFANANSPFIRFGHPSDISGSNPVKAIDDFYIRGDGAIIHQIEWLGSSFPESMSWANPIFEVTFYHNVYDREFSSFFPYRPEVVPFSTHLIEPFVAETGLGSNGAHTRYRAYLESDVILEPGNYWVSVSLVAPTTENYNFVWHWSGANALGVATLKDASTGEQVQTLTEMRLVLLGWD